MTFDEELKYTPVVRFREGILILWFEKKEDGLWMNLKLEMDIFF